MAWRSICLGPCSGAGPWRLLFEDLLPWQSWSWALPTLELTELRCPSCFIPVSLPGTWRLFSEDSWLAIDLPVSSTVSGMFWVCGWLSALCRTGRKMIPGDRKNSVFFSPLRRFPFCHRNSWLCTIFCFWPSELLSPVVISHSLKNSFPRLSYQSPSCSPFFSSFLWETLKQSLHSSYFRMNNS